MESEASERGASERGALRLGRRRPRGNGDFGTADKLKLELQTKPGGRRPKGKGDTALVHEWR